MQMLHNKICTEARALKKMWKNNGSGKRWRGRKQTDGKWGSENFLLKVYLKKLCPKISQNADGVN